MAEPNEQQPQANEQEQQSSQQKQFVATYVYTKDVSFETPNSPQIFLENSGQWNPDIETGLSNRVVKVGEDTHEVTLTITVTAKHGDKTVYLAEVHQAGLFTIKGYSKTELSELLGSYCPNVLFPFAREVIANLVVKGGFRQILLGPVNFEALYHEHLKDMYEKQQSPSELDS